MFFNDRTWIKICGITSAEDGMMSAELGANAVGFVFASSKRQISLRQARGIVKTLPPEILKVGVFMNQSLEEVNAFSVQSGMDMVQLHGKESPEFCKIVDCRLSSASLFVNRIHRIPFRRK